MKMNCMFKEFLFLVTQPPPTVAPKNFRVTLTTQTTIEFSWDALDSGVETFGDVSMFIIRCYERNNNITVSVHVQAVVLQIIT